MISITAAVSPLWLVVLVCPVVMSFLMFFMMRGMHGGHGHEDGHSETGVDLDAREAHQWTRDPIAEDTSGRSNRDVGNA